jgi:type I restriction enzyme S subunit
MEKGKKPLAQSKEPADGYLPYVDIKAFEQGIIDNYATTDKSLLCDDGDLLIVCDGSRSGLTGIAIKGVVGSTLSKIYADGLTTEYLRYFIQSKYLLLNTQKKGTGTPHLNANILKTSKLVVPSIPEQQRIVSRIEELFSSLDNAVETLQKTKEQLTVYRQAVLKEAFDSIHESATANIESLCQNIVDCPHSTPKWTKDGYLCLRTTNFKRGKLDLCEKNFVSKETFDERNTRLVPLPGDVLYSREGAILGIACIIPKGTYVCLGQRMMLLRPGKTLNNRFLMYYLNSPALTNFVASKTGGSASPHVNVGDIKAFMIPCPDICIQEKIAIEIDNKMSVCDNIEQTVNTALTQAEAVRQSILKEAFEGRL